MNYITSLGTPRWEEDHVGNRGGGGGNDDDDDDDDGGGGGGGRTKVLALTDFLRQRSPRNRLITEHPVTFSL